MQQTRSPFTLADDWFVRPFNGVQASPVPITTYGSQCSDDRIVRFPSMIQPSELQITPEGSWFQNHWDVHISRGIQVTRVFFMYDKIRCPQNYIVRLTDAVPASMELIKLSDNWRTHYWILRLQCVLEQPNIPIRPDKNKFANNWIVNHSDAIQNSHVIMTLHISQCWIVGSYTFQTLFQRSCCPSE